jgi:hypothetical protein
LVDIIIDFKYSHTGAPNYFCCPLNASSLWEAVLCATSAAMAGYQMAMEFLFYFAVTIGWW